MYIDLLTEDNLKKGLNQLYYRKLELVSFNIKEVKPGMIGHLVTAVDDSFVTELMSSKKNPMRPDKVIGNFLIYIDKKIAVDSIQDTNIVLKLANKGSYTLVNFDRMEYNSTWWVLPEGTRL